MDQIWYSSSTQGTEGITKKLRGVINEILEAIVWIDSEGNHKRSGSSCSFFFSPSLRNYGWNQVWFGGGSGTIGWRSCPSRPHRASALEALSPSVSWRGQIWTAQRDQRYGPVDWIFLLFGHSVGIGALECSEAEHAVCDTSGDSAPSADPTWPRLISFLMCNIQYEF